MSRNALLKQDSSSESVLSFADLGWKKIVPKPDHIADLERRQKTLEDEVAKASLHYSTDDPMILDLKRRVLPLVAQFEQAIEIERPLYVGRVD